MISRLSQFLEYQGINVRQFEQLISASNGMIRKAITNNTDIQSKWIAKIIDNFPNLNPEWLLTGKGNMLRDDNPPVAAAIEARQSVTALPLIPITAFAGFGSQAFQDLQVEHYYEVPEFKQADFLMRIKGNSMYPKYSSGDIVACAIIEETLFFQWNKIYAIYTKSQGVLVKRVKPSKIKDHIMLVSDNTQYDPFDVPIADISRLALIIGVIRVE